MKFESGKTNYSFGYEVRLVEKCKGAPSGAFNIYKGNYYSCINIAVDLDYLKKMDGAEIARLELLLHDLKKYAELGECEE